MGKLLRKGEKGILVWRKVHHVTGGSHGGGNLFSRLNPPELDQPLSGLLERFRQQTRSLRVSFSIDNSCCLHLLGLLNKEPGIFCVSII